MTDSSTASDLAPPAGPVLRYDGECPFCRHRVERLIQLSRGRVRAEPLQSAVEGGATAGEIKLLMPDGRMFGGAEAVFRALALRPMLRPLLWLYLVPGLRQIANLVYRWVAANRYRFSAVTCADGVCARHLRQGVASPEVEYPRLGEARPTFRRSAKVFLVLVGLLHLAAFAGLYPQVLLLMGQDGLMPAAEILERVRAGDSPHPYWDFPTVFWLDASDFTLRAGCVAGIILSLLVIFGILRRTALVLLEILYLSYVVAGTTFFYFQWDNLLIETTLHALLLPSYSRALLRRSPAAQAAQLRTPHPSAVFLMHWLLFRVYFESGLAKVQVPGGGWRDLSAMGFYYDTAPLATWLGWYAHNLPAWWHQWETALTLLVEVLLPVFIFSSRRWRRPLFVIFCGFQLGILLTANYGLFNYTTLALGLFLLEDRDYDGVLRWGRWLKWLVRGRERRAASAQAIHSPGPLAVVARSMVMFTATAAIVAASLLEFMVLVSDRGAKPLLGEYRDGYKQLRLVNSYHLFASITRERLVPEIQGLDENGEWVTYRWRFAPADPRDPPRLVAPYHPRLDFQLWFVTLSGPVEQRHPFFMRLLKIICEQPERAAEFFAFDPFAGRRPRMLRVMLFRYNLSDAEARRRDGSWWRREPAGRLTRDFSCPAATPAGRS